MTGPPPPHTPSRTSSYASQNTTNTTSDRNAALAGAALAFARPQTKAVSVERRNNGALAAAARVGSTPSPKASNVSVQVSQREAVGQTPARQRPAHSAFRGVNTFASLRPPRRDATERSKSPSQHAAAMAASQTPNTAKKDDLGQAAALASSRAAQARSKPTPKPKPRRLSSSSTLSSRASQQPSDMEHVQPTRSLVRMFEQKSNETTPVRVNMRRGSTTPAPRTFSAKPALPSKPSNGITSMFQLELEEDNKWQQPRSRSGTLSRTLSQSDGASSDVDDAYTSAAEELTPMESFQAATPEPAPTSSNTAFLELRPRSTIDVQQYPSPSPLQQAAASSAMPIKMPPPRASAHAPSPSPPRSLAAGWRSLHPRHMSPLTTGDDLANAMIASSLASSRAPSPHKLAPPPVPTRKQNHRGRTVSPAKQGLRRSLRSKADDSGSSDENGDNTHPYGKHRKKRHLRKHPNKHHEGDRKRWRDAVTERERKRYEGLWAANRGLYCMPSPTPITQHDTASEPSSDNPEPVRQPHTDNTEDQVSSLVVREVWNRSRLPLHDLESIYDLVDLTHRSGKLERGEFVVGLWLVDQRLKGRKLPTRVSATVWASVRAVNGVKVRK